jgi:hypothetical protein
MAMDVHDFMGDSAAAVMREILAGMFEGLISEIELTEEGAHVLIDSPTGEWVLTLRKAPRDEILQSVLTEAAA